MLEAIGQFGRAAAGAVLFSMLVCAAVMPAAASRTANEFARSLNEAERGQFEDWYKAQVFHDAAMDAYWAEVEKKRSWRRAKRRKRQGFVDQDYVTSLPPVYEGPNIGAPILRRWYQFRNGAGEAGKERATLPGLDVYLGNAKRFYDFEPERIPEVEFKRRYALEALKLGLTKDQVVRVYALETGGRGTADMQAGIHPITGKGKPISSALGYAQLLAANSVNVLSKHGPKMVIRLEGMTQQEANPQRRSQLQHKLTVLRRMVRAAQSVPYKWSEHIAYARTPKGQALHVMNIDGVIGPWMQVVKLADLKLLAERHGRTELSGAELELMNLAGPATGLEMMLETGLDKPTSNFFSRRAYYRNTVVRGKDSRGLLVALEDRMRASLKNPGSVEFLEVFDAIEREKGRSRAAAPSDLRPSAFNFVPRDFRPQN